MHLSKPRLILILIFMLVLAGCGGGQAEVLVQPTFAPTEAVSFLMTSTPMPPTSTATRIPPLPAPTEINLESLLPDLRAGQYSLTLAGVINSNMGFTPPGEGFRAVTYQPLAFGTNTEGPFQLTLWTDLLTDGTTNDTNAQVIFTFPALEAGTYDIVGQDVLNAPNQVGVEVVSGEGISRFATQALGKMTIVANDGFGGVFSGEFEATVSDASGNAVIVSGRASGIPLLPLPSAEVALAGAVTLNPTIDELFFNLAPDQTSSANDDWRLDVSIVTSETNPFIIQHQIFMIPNIVAGTYDIKPPNSPLDARSAEVDVTARVEIYDTRDGTQVEITDIEGTLTIEPLRDVFTATFTLTYNTPDGEVTATGGAYNLLRPGS